MQILVLDVVFALDSIITAVGMTDHLPVMVAAVVIAMLVMLLAADPVGDFVNAHPTVKMLALSVPAAGRRGADRGRDALPHPARLPLLRDRVLRGRGGPEPTGVEGAQEAPGC